MNAPIWFHNLLAYSVQVALLVTAGELLPRLFRMRWPRALLAYWQLLLAICLALPVLQPWQRVAVSVPDGVVIGSLRIGAVTSAASRFPSLSLYEIAGLILLAGVVVRLAWLATGLLRLHFYRRRARPLAPVPTAVKEMRLLVNQPVCFYVSPEIDSPVTCGELHPAVLLPTRFQEMPDEYQKAVVCHELSHVRRHDWAWHLAEEFVRAIFWFHPAVWWLISRIRLAREQVVDGEVLRLLKSRKPYLEALLEIASCPAAPRAVPAPLFLAERQLPQRIAAMLKEVSMSKTRLVVSLAGIAVLLILSGGLVVWSLPLLRAPVSETLQVLKPVYAVPPSYPDAAKKLHLEGTVTMDATLDARGQVTDLQVIDGPPLLVKAALDAAKLWRYSPPALAPAHTLARVNFTLSSAATPAPASSDPPANNQDSEKVYKVGGDVKAPVPYYKPEPNYSPQAKKDKVQGTVVLWAVIDATGNVVDATLQKSLRPDMDENAINTVRTWKFKPATRKGKPVSVKVMIEINFRLY